MLPNLKELRPGSSGGSEIRLLFAFDLRRKAVVLVAGDKAGNWDDWYDENIPVAEARFMVMAKWCEVRAKAVAEGQLDEDQLAEHKNRLLAETRAYKLAELRRAYGLNQTVLAERLGLTQARVSQIESGNLETAELGTLRAYVNALGGELEISYHVGGERYILS